MVCLAGEGDGATVVRTFGMVTGIVQGVGFRPFVYCRAKELGLTGWVRNTPAGVELEVQGEVIQVDAFFRAIRQEHPPLAVIDSIMCHERPLASDQMFSILPSGPGDLSVVIPPDSSLCADCLRELFDPSDRRFRYPFITCTNCGPRYSIITGIPYDRPRTTMVGFPLCPACSHEYHDPENRRFHAQPIACPACGPRLQLVDREGNTLATGDEALLRAVDLLRDGKIVVVKGLGGYHLAVDAANNTAVERLRLKKNRDEKPFAVMVADVAAARRLVELSVLEERLLTGVEAPIVIARKQPGSALSPLIAPDNGWLGVMLPYTPLHHLMLKDQFPAVVMTSANRSDEPIIYKDAEALSRLGSIADVLLTHDRPIHTRQDDSVIRVFQGKPLFYRRARGYVPRSVKLPFAVTPMLGVGAELKSTFCLAHGTQAVLSQHLGDLQNGTTYDSFRSLYEHLSLLMGVSPGLVACDEHPDYLSTAFATELCADGTVQLIPVQHHHAHLASCMAEHGLEGDVIGLIYDGTGYGYDGTIWGGEVLVGGYGRVERYAHFRTVPLPGGDAAVREPWRMALAYLYGALGPDCFTLDHPVATRLSPEERAVFSAMVERGLNSPLTSSCGRLFDGVAALLGVRSRVSYEGQAAIELEALAEQSDDREWYPLEITRQLNFCPLFPRMFTDLASGVALAIIARRFHTTLAHASVQLCEMVSADTGLDRVVLSGGVFQNRLLTELLYTQLAERGFQVYCHRLIPPNDGGIALGQVAVAGKRGN